MLLTFRNIPRILIFLGVYDIPRSQFFKTSVLRLRLWMSHSGSFLLHSLFKPWEGLSTILWGNSWRDSKALQILSSAFSLTSFHLCFGLPLKRKTNKTKIKMTQWENFFVSKDELLGWGKFIKNSILSENSTLLSKISNLPDYIYLQRTTLGLKLLLSFLDLGRFPEKKLHNLESSDAGYAGIIQGLYLRNICCFHLFLKDARIKSNYPKDKE